MKKVLVFAVAVMMLLSMAGAAFADKLSEIQETGTFTVGANVAFPPYEFYWTNPETGEVAAEAAVSASDAYQSIYRR